MLNFNDEKLNELVANFISYMVDPKHDNGKLRIEIDRKNLFYHIDTRNSKSNLNIVISSHLITNEQKEKAAEIIANYHQNQIPFTWCTITTNNEQAERHFLEKQGLQHFETAIGMIIDLTTFKLTNHFNPNEHFVEADNITVVNAIEEIVKNAFDLSLIDLAKYQSIWELNQHGNISYLTTLVKNNITVSTGNLYFEKK